ncbi:ADP-heptose--LPS heptosyltransferase 2 [Polystyrenella longa]|uniref:lipopolysaccharide heptosyltransferase II n=2 Tax=Polystyrenella longa TaxID=2528007 RepID=A0A518CPP2_9PLAN|nr:ADP-heptose--LPS heptosyltransferase 2 [Polystyrenella longa]
MVTAPSSKQTPLDLMDARRICIIKPSALGDVVQTLPLLPMLRERFPKAKISWVINSSFANLLEEHPALDEIIPFNRQGGWREWPPLIKQLRAGKFDLVLDLQGLLRTAVMTWSTRAPVRIGLQTAREMSHFACHQLIPDSDKQMPAYNRMWRVAEALGMGATPRETIITVSDSDRQIVEEKLAPISRPFVAIQPGAQWSTKRWPVEKFAEVAARAADTHDLAMVLIGSQGERLLAQQLQQEIQQRNPNAIVLDLAGETTLKQLSHLLERSTMLLTNDSGPMHLAAGLQVPLVGVFTSTSSVRSGPPPTSTTRLVTTTDACQACYKKICPRTGDLHLTCQKRLSTAPVLDAVNQLVTQLQARAA